MTFLATAIFLKPDEIAPYINGLKWTTWRPKFLTVHNTGVPTLKTWMDPAHTARQRIEGQRHYERDILRWHSGPHVFMAPDGAWILCDPTQDGVSVSCWNHQTFAIEMIGDYEIESFSDGLGAKVRDNTVILAAALHNKLGWDPADYEIGVKGLHFHKECLRDKHRCPGKNVDKGDVIARIVAEMARQKGVDHVA